MTVLNRKLVRGEIATALAADATVSGLVSSVYSYQKGRLGGESPVVEVLSGGIGRSIAGMGAKRYDSSFELELHILVYDGDDDNPLTESQRDDAVDDIEAAIAAWCAAHQSGTYYRALRYTDDGAKPTEITNVKMLDGNPYRLEIVTLSVEAPDL